MLISLVSFLFVFTFIALIHEFGHLILAKRAGIRVFEFGVGFGPRLAYCRFHDTIYSLNLIPILAFVRIAGEGDSDEDNTCPESERYQAKSVSQKFKTIVAGPLMNILGALLLLAVLFTFVGIPSGASNEIGSVNPGSPAEKAGLKPGDRLLAIDGVAYPKMDEAIRQIHQNNGASIRLLLLRQDKQLELVATPKYNSKMKVALLGFSPKPLYQRTNPFSAIFHACLQTVSMVIVTAVIVFHLFTGSVSIADLAGPVGIAQITGKYAQSGLISLIYFTSFISVNIGVLNLLPLPALDGGRLVFVIIEAIRRKPLPIDVENKINYWGMIALLSLMALITFQDILRLISGQ